MDRNELPRLGKKGYVHDPRTLMMNLVLAPPPTIAIPATWDFDKHRAKLPLGLWGNDEFGDCVLVGRANHLVRNDRVETRRTLPITTNQVVGRYKEMTGCVNPGDSHDTGLAVIEALRDWRAGWMLKFGTKAPANYRIQAFGGLSYTDRHELRAAAYLLHGIQFGIVLPNTAKEQWRKGQEWDDTGTDEYDAQPGSWGGHLVYAKRYDDGGFYCVTWGNEQYMTNRFIERYCDEAWAAVDALNDHSRYMNVDLFLKYLRDVGAQIID